MTDDELHQTKMESQPGSNNWEWANAEQQARDRLAQNRKMERASEAGPARTSETHMKIFWSWQSDTPGKIGRHLIRDALREAIDQLKQAEDIEEPIRDALHLDHDIQDVTGSPDLARTILDKIDASEVVVADVTAVGEVVASADSEKKLINSNVAIELGYALRARTDQNVILVFNEHYGKHQDLPFDLRHKGGAITFDLRPDAERSQIAEQKKKLKDRFVRALKPFLGHRTVASTPLVETPHTFNRAAYFEVGVGLAPTRGDFRYQISSLCYLRVIPKLAPAMPLELAALKEKVLAAPLLRDGAYQSVLHDINKYGAINCTFDGSRLTASTQLFENGEVWCVSASLIRTERDGIPQRIKLPCLSVSNLEQVYSMVAPSVIEFAGKSLELEPPWFMELGLAGIGGLYLNVGADELNGQKGPVHKGEIVVRTLIEDRDSDALNVLLQSFFSKVYDSVGERRPATPSGPAAARR